MRSDPSITALRLQLAQEAAQFGYWDYEVATSALVWDHSCAALFGITLAEFEGTLEGFRARCCAEDLPLVEQTLATTGPGESMEVTFRVVLPDGSLRHMLSRGQALPGSDGEVERMVGVLLDVTRLHSGAERLGGLARVALAMAGAGDDESLTRIVIEHGASVLGADGGAVCVRDDQRGIIRLAMTDSLGPEVQLEFGELPLDGPLPGSYTARTGEPVFLPDRASGLAFSPSMQVVYDGTDRDAWAVLPLRSSDRLLGSLVVSWSEPRGFDPDEQELLAAFAAQTAQALDRIQVLQAERRQAKQARRLSETLQRSLLTSPPQPDGLQIAVRYAPAAEQAAVGGDWYDAFLVPGGALTLVIGDCVGHDRQAAAAMATMRNLLRGTAFAIGEPPAAVLKALERAIAGLEVEVLATALLACVDAAPEAPGARRVTWSNAGHLPPLLRLADGSARLLESAPDLLLGLSTTDDRHDSHLDVPEGAILLLYTDGLVERRGEDLDVGIERLRSLVSSVGDLSLEQLCDAVLDGMLADVQAGAEDDVALLAVRFATHDAEGTATTTEVTLPSELSSARVARQFVGSFLEAAGASAWREAAELGVSEVVTNAVLHAHTAVTVTATLEHDRVRVEVRDHNPSLPLHRGYDEQATTGRGMSLVAAVTNGHGVNSLGADGKVVWFTVGDEAGPEQDLLSLWADLSDEALEDEGTPAAVLLGLPTTLWQAACQHHDAMVRELTLQRATLGLPHDDLVAADAARRVLSDAVDHASAADTERSEPPVALPEGHPSPLPLGARSVDAVIPALLPASAYATLQDVLDEAERLAIHDELLVRPGLPEIVAVRDWACEQVIAQLGGTPPSRWPGTDDQRFTEVVDDGRRSVDWDPATVATAAVGAVAVDDANRIVAISPPLLALIGYPLEEILGRRVVVLVPPRYREAHVAGFTRHLTTGVAHVLGVELELPVLRSDGTELSCRFLIEVTGTPSGRSVYTAWITPLP